MNEQQKAIGIFDSGVGGISTLQVLAKMLPQENFIFYGDSANAPYGEKSGAEVQVLANEVVTQLQAQAVKAVVIACNTATSAAKTELIAQHPTLPILGIEPALKAAVDAGKQHILVMATPLTLSLAKYKTQLAKWGQQQAIYSLPCPGLADLIEGGATALPQIKVALNRLLATVRQQPIDAVVLGCTHYPFITDLIREQLGQPVTFYTGYEGLGRNLQHQLQQRNLLRTTNAQPTVRFMSSRDTPAELALYQQLFDHGLQ